MPEVGGTKLDKKQLYIIGGAAVLAGGFWLYEKKKSAAAASTGTDASTTATDTGQGINGDTTDYGQGGFGAGSGSGFGGGVPGNFSGLPPVTTTSTPVATSGSPSTNGTIRGIVVNKGETQADIIQAAGIPYAQLIALNPGVKLKGGKIHAGQHLNV